MKPILTSFSALLLVLCALTCPYCPAMGVETGTPGKAAKSLRKIRIATRYRARKIIFAYDLRNEPEVGWNERMKPAWNRWLQKRYGDREKFALAWGARNQVDFSDIPIPPPKDELNSRQLIDFQHFRED